MGFARGVRFLQFDDSATEANRDSLCAITRPQLLRDVSIPVPPGNLTEDFYLTCRQVFVAQMLRELCRQLRRDALLSRMNLPNHFNQILGRHALEHVTAGSRLQRPLDFHVAFKGRQHNDARLGEFRSDGYHRIDTTLVRKPEVHESYVWLVLPKLLNAFLCVGRLGY